LADADQRPRGAGVFAHPQQVRCQFESSARRPFTSFGEKADDSVRPFSDVGGFTAVYLHARVAPNYVCRRFASSEIEQAFRRE